MIGKPAARCSSPRTTWATAHYWNAPFRDAGLGDRVRMVENGDQLLAYLLRREQYADAARYPAPGLVLLDLNMPRKDGMEVIEEIRSQEGLKRLPVVVLTTSEQPEDVERCYALGANAFVTKPVEMGRLVRVIRELYHYWFDVVSLPRGPEPGGA
ncbi:MAG: response regulator [Deltaproteobacteria bacterium]|nr:response regulator [Deltaproteobacteria bacterium]